MVLRCVWWTILVILGLVFFSFDILPHLFFYFFFFFSCCSFSSFLMINLVAPASPAAFSPPASPSYISTVVTCRLPASSMPGFVCRWILGSFGGGSFLLFKQFSSSFMQSAAMEFYAGFLQHNLAWVSCQTDWRLIYCPRARASISSVLMLYAFLTYVSLVNRSWSVLPQLKIDHLEPFSPLENFSGVFLPFTALCGELLAELYQWK